MEARISDKDDILWLEMIHNDKFINWYDYNCGILFPNNIDRIIDELLYNIFLIL